MGSRPITVFATHRGLFRYKGLMFGVSCAPEMYQRVIQQVFEGCEGVRNTNDDIIVHGRTVDEHDRRLEKAMERIQDKGLMLKKEKCKFRMSELELMGHLLSACGIEPTQAKLEAVIEARQPHSAAEVRSFLGLVNFCTRLIPELATVSKSLKPPEPLKRTERPSGPWQHISVGVMTPSLSSGHRLLVVIDYYSHYVEVEVLRSMTADKIIPSIKKIFLTHRLPVSITTDNGPQFISRRRMH